MHTSIGQHEEGADAFPKISWKHILDAPRILPEPADLTHDLLKIIEDELGLIKFCWASGENSGLPASYTENSNKEKLILFYAENFRRQFSHKYPHRKPLFLASDNEAGLKKMVCTTLRPTTLPYPDIENWKDCAAFVGNQLIYETLEIPTLIPKYLRSPHLIFMQQKGHAFELATALCSLLLGLGYDAYVVSGYATRDVTLKIMSRLNPPRLPEQNTQKINEKTENPKKYTLKQPRDLRSKFLLMMEQREIDSKLTEKNRLEQIEMKRLQDEEQPPFDELHGLRLHSWVLILKNQRFIDGEIFIEPSTGMVHPLNWSNYLGIESLWNNLNYWINMQDCSKGLDNLDYDLTKLENWQHLFPGEPIEMRKTELDMNMDENEMVLATIMEEKHLDTTIIGWSMKIFISYDVLHNRYPDGKLTTWYKRTVVNEYASYRQSDGLIRNITKFKDFACTEPLTVENYYENRNDGLLKKIYNIQTELIIDYFGTGRSDGVSEHHYYKNPEIDDKETIIEFYSKARADGLKKLEYKSTIMIVNYTNRNDKLHYLQVNYAKKGCAPPGMIESHRKTILNITEKFERNVKISVSDDVEIRQFDLVNGIINLKFQYDEGKVTASTRMFIKPPIADMGESIKFNPELTQGYEAKIGGKPPRKLQLFRLLEKMVREEEKSISRIRDLENQIEEYHLLRNLENNNPQLVVSVFNVEQNREHRLKMLKMENEMRENKEKEVEEHVDYLMPYLARLGFPGKLTKNQALKMKDDCLNDFKNLMLKRARIIQKQFDDVAEKLLQKHYWFKLNHAAMTADQEADYAEETNQLIGLLSVFELRLARHGELSSIRYEMMVNYVKNHPKLKKYFI